METKDLIVYYGIIYKCTNLVNGKVYIGQTKHSLESRRKSHYSSALYNNSNLIFHKALRKYSKDKFNWEIIKTCSSKDELNFFEQFYISLYCSFVNKNGYNVAKGGNGGDTYSNQPEERKIEIGKNISKTLSKRTSEDRNKTKQLRRENKKSKSEEERKLSTKKWKDTFSKKTKEEIKASSVKGIETKQRKIEQYGKDIYISLSDVWFSKSEEERNAINKKRSYTLNNKSDQEKMEIKRKQKLAKRGYLNPLIKPVLCITDQIIFKSIGNACHYYKIGKYKLKESIKNNGEYINKKFVFIDNEFLKELYLCMSESLQNIVDNSLDVHVDTILKDKETLDRLFLKQGLTTKDCKDISAGVKVYNFLQSQ